MDFHKIGVKVYAEHPLDDPLDLIPVFHRWIQQSLLDDLLIDVADYSHVPQGPGIMLIAHEGNYALDETTGRPGLAYYSKRELAGGLDERLATVLGKALAACRLLEQDSELRFRGEALQVFVNDRLAAPNDDASLAALEPVLGALAARLYPGQEISLERADTDPRERLGIELRAPEAVTVTTLLERLEGGDRPA